VPPPADAIWLEIRLGCWRAATDKDAATERTANAGRRMAEDVLRR